MLGWFLPQETSFFDYFEAHAALIVQGAELFDDMVSKQKDSKETAALIKRVEHQADIITQQCIETLHKTFITPFDRDSISALISRMDDIMDEIDAAAECIVIYRVTEMTAAAKDFASLLNAASQSVARIVSGLRSTKNGASMNEEGISIHKLENQSDEIFRKALGTLFDEEKDTRMLIKWKDIYEHLENAIDRCEDVANIVDGILMELD